MSKETKFTPGPYAARFSRTYSGGQYDIVADNGRKTIAETIGAPHEANGRLLAASPTLYAACEFIGDYERFYCGVHARMGNGATLRDAIYAETEKARAAIDLVHKVQSARCAD